MQGNPNSYGERVPRAPMHEFDKLHPALREVFRNLPMDYYHILPDHVLAWPLDTIIKAIEHEIAIVLKRDKLLVWGDKDKP